MDDDESEDEDECADEHAEYVADDDVCVLPVMTRGVMTYIPSLRGNNHSTRPFLVTCA
jgi:hypothetical protein